jgi:ABC-type proline/glycine betaine transport system permease subunit
MSIKDWLDKNIGRKWRKILDQILHFLWAFIALIPVMVMGPTVIAGIMSALLFALPREIVDQWPIDHWDDTLLDLAFFALGGAVAGMIF